MNTTYTNRHKRRESGVRQDARPRRQFSSSSQSNFKRQGGQSRNSTSQNFRSQRGGFQRGKRKMPTFDPTQFINTNPVGEKETTYTPKHSFETFGLHKGLVENLKKMGLRNPTPIQDQIIPSILEKHDVIGLAETGTGKTAAFLLPVLNHTIENPRRSTLILTPTRELAIQIERELHTLSKGFRIFSVTCVGGANIGPQIRALSKPNHFIIGTPGRILDLIERRKFNPVSITTVVLDEADRMLDMGFIHDIKKIVGMTPSKRETLFFSATISSQAEDLMHSFLRNPKMVSVKKKDVTQSIEQDVIRYRQDAKFETLLKELEKKEYSRVIVFGSMKHAVERLAVELSKNNIRSESLHGNKTHGQRQRALTKFKEGAVRVLVATDVAARGIHVDDVSHVINYDLPNTFDDYVHRIGRTGRGTKKGKALSFVPVSERRY